MNHSLSKSSFAHLTPEHLMSVLESVGLFPTGEYSQLNSYENRVFDVRLEKTPLSSWDQQRVIVKAYRPGRWSEAALREEHEFMQELEQEGLPTAPPLRLFDGDTLHLHQGFYFALFPRVMGRMPQEFLEGDLRAVGRSLARLHNVGARHESQHRPTYHPDVLGDSILDTLQQWAPPEIWTQYLELAEYIFEELAETLDLDKFQRIHGDCHRGNLLQDSSGLFFFVDFDDFGPGPVEQDFWMLLSSEGNRQELDEILEGYETLRHAPEVETRTLRLLRAFRILRYAAWIGARWSDPSFPRIFPEFNTYNYWAEELQTLRHLST